MGGDETHSHDVFERVNERWPGTGDQLLSPGRDTFFATSPTERAYRLRRGFKNAGDTLVQAALADLADRGNLVFPALFNYRHYIELALKDIIDDHGAFAGVSLGTKSHKLPELWQLFVEIVVAFSNDCSDAAAVAVGRCVDEFAKIDANSTAFRYARNMQGDVPSLPSDGLDLVNLRDVMNGIENFLECADLDFTHKTNFDSV
jgi:hypothetical protein